MTVQTVITSILLYVYIKNVWMALSLTLVIVGGLMISFVYVSSLIPAEPYTRTFMWISPVVFIPFLLICTSSISTQFINYSVEFTPVNLFNYSIYLGTILVVSILIVTLLIVCINTLQVKSPMRSYN